MAVKQEDDGVEEDGEEAPGRRIDAWLLLPYYTAWICLGVSQSAKFLLSQPIWIILTKEKSEQMLLKLRYKHYYEWKSWLNFTGYLSCVYG